MSAVAAFGRVAKIQDVPTQGVTRLVIEIPLEAFKRAVAVFHAMEVLVTLAPPSIGKENAYGILGDSETPQPAAGMGVRGADLAPPRGVVAKTGDSSAVGPKCRATVQWCAAPAFQNWLADAFPEQWAAADGVEPQTCAGKVVKMLLGIASRKEIDTDPRAGREWEELVRIPWLAHQGLIEREPF